MLSERKTDQITKLAKDSYYNHKCVKYRKSFNPFTDVEQHELFKKEYVKQHALGKFVEACIEKT